MRLSPFYVIFILIITGQLVTSQDQPECEWFIVSCYELSFSWFLSVYGYQNITEQREGRHYFCCCKVTNPKSICISGIVTTTTTTVTTESLCDVKNWRDEIVLSGEYWTRPLEGWMEVTGFNHHGVVLITNCKRRWLIHSTPGSGVVVTAAENMSSNWSKREDFLCPGEKTVDDVFAVATGRTTIKWVNYITSLTCIYTAEKAEEFCTKV